MEKPVKGEVVVLETKEDFDAFLEAAGSTLVVIDFFADWCGPCKRIKPIFVIISRGHLISSKRGRKVEQYDLFYQMQQFAVEFAEKAYFAKVNVDENEDTAGSEGISAMPTFKLYKNGQKVGEVTGANETKLKEMIEKNI